MSSAHILTCTIVCVGVSAQLVGCRAAPDHLNAIDDDEAPRSLSLREVTPGVRADLAERVIEFDGFVPINVNDPDAPVVWLEVAVCAIDTREHESLVATDVTPSNIHAALLLIGLEPGKPGKYLPVASGGIERVSPTGPPVDVTIVFDDIRGRTVEQSALEWVLDDVSGKSLRDSMDASWRFAGSDTVRFRGRDWYAADGGGVIVGLSTFADRASAPIIGWSEIVSDLEAIDAPRYRADPDRVPVEGTPVRVRISSARSSGADEE